jgi:hypothetical protein
MIIANLTGGQYVTFLSNLQSSPLILEHITIDAYNGTFRTSLGHFKYTYLPSDGLGNIVYSVVSTDGDYPFTANEDIIGHINSAVNNLGY